MRRMLTEAEKEELIALRAEKAKRAAVSRVNGRKGGRPRLPDEKITKAAHFKRKERAKRKGVTA